MEFREMNLQSELVETLQRNGIKNPTKIQEEVIPSAIAGQDIRAQSETGSGKTLAFAIPIIEKVERGRGVQALILAPTRELAQQITVEFKKFSKHRNIHTLAVYGGASINVQISEIGRTEIVVGTPGRLLDLLERNELNFKSLKVLVLDEADRMLDMGFIRDIEKIIHQIPHKSQTMFFSATYPSEVKDIANKYLVNPKKVVIHSTLEKGKLLQYYYDVKQNNKFSLLLHLLKKEKSETTLVFCKTKRMTELVSKNLYQNGVKARALNGDMSQAKRDRVVDEFKRGQINVLVATDVAARGIHVENISHVYNYDIPDTPETYTHRIGRTARAGKTGTSVNLVCDMDHDNFGRIIGYRGDEIKKVNEENFEKIPFKTGGGERHGFQRKRWGQRNHEGRSDGGRFPKREGEGGRRFGRNDQRQRNSRGFSGKSFGSRKPRRGPE